MKGHLHSVTARFVIDVPDAILDTEGFIKGVVEDMHLTALYAVIASKVMHIDDLGLMVPVNYHPESK